MVLLPQIEVKDLLPRVSLTRAFREIRRFSMCFLQVLYKAFLYISRYIHISLLSIEIYRDEKYISDHHTNFELMKSVNGHFCLTKIPSTIAVFGSNLYSLVLTTKGKTKYNR